MNFVSAFGRLSLGQVRGIATTPAKFIQTTPCLFAEPLKRKKRIDPSIVKARDDRKKKKIEKQIRKLEKNSRQMKPIDECEAPIHLFDKDPQYVRPAVKLSEEVLEGRILLEKSWAKYRRDQHLRDLQMLDRIAFSQQHALDELRKESEELYQEAIQVDFTLLPFNAVGPVNTPKIDDYEAPDGDYVDVSRQW
ncbi:PREDICTED: 39S ribosomal protein L40, mitochondrial [Nicrophorus vespilloides]|uniref:Large ribosomal subunit protein mL40 n=1 Tax=Nicrophorus vespilloides TaxID=110193 RepID=A0ABM1MZ37_NICVS|nr:PREDICTED: 39S ribosomal protein L40, mitochondrial [Nicrophorus vespilloides]